MAKPKASQIDESADQEAQNKLIQEAASISGDDQKKEVISETYGMAPDQLTNEEKADAIKAENEAIRWAREQETPKTNDPVASRPPDPVDKPENVTDQEWLEFQQFRNAVNNLPTKKDDVKAAPSEAELHLQRVKQYGEGYVLAKKGNFETVFTQMTWQRLPTNKDGWQQIVSTPPEVAAMIGTNPH